MIGDLRGEIVDAYGKKREIQIKNVSYTPHFEIKLFSITTAVKNSMKLGNNGLSITLENEDIKLSFDQLLKTRNSYLEGMEIQPKQDFNVKNQGLVMKKQKIVNLNQMHEWLGHPHLEIVKRTASVMGIKLVGTFLTCHACAMGKACQKNIVRFNTHQSTIIGEHIYVDISYITHARYGGAKYWVLVIDEYTKYKWCKFIIFIFIFKV